MIATTDDPHQTWVMPYGRYGSQQSGIQAVINSELTLARWDGQSPIITCHDDMKHTRLAASGPTITAIQFYRHLTNSLPAEYDMVVAVHDPSPPTTRLTSYAKDSVPLSSVESCVPLRMRYTRGPSCSARGAEGIQGQWKVIRNSRSSSKGKRPSITLYGCGKR